MLVHLHPVHNSFFREAQRKMGKTPATLRSVDRGIAPSERCNRKLTLVHKDGRECEVEVRSYEDSTMVHADRLLTLYVKSGKVYTRIHVHMDDAADARFLHAGQGAEICASPATMPGPTRSKRICAMPRPPDWV